MPFSFSPVKGIIRIVFSYILVLSCVFCHIFAQSYDILILLSSILEDPDNLSPSTAIYMLNFSRVL